MVNNDHSVINMGTMSEFYRAELDLLKRLATTNGPNSEFALGVTNILLFQLHCTYTLLPDGTSADAELRDACDDTVGIMIYEVSKLLQDELCTFEEAHQMASLFAAAVQYHSHSPATIATSLRTADYSDSLTPFTQKLSPLTTTVIDSISPERFTYTPNNALILSTMLSEIESLNTPWSSEYYEGTHDGGSSVDDWHELLRWMLDTGVATVPEAVVIAKSHVMSFRLHPVQQVRNTLETLTDPVAKRLVSQLMALNALKYPHHEIDYAELVSLLFTPEAFQLPVTLLMSMVKREADTQLWDELVALSNAYQCFTLLSSSPSEPATHPEQSM